MFKRIAYVIAGLLFAFIVLLFIVPFSIYYCLYWVITGKKSFYEGIEKLFSLLDIPEKIL